MYCVILPTAAVIINNRSPEEIEPPTENGKDLTQSYDKIPHINEKLKMQSDNTKTPPKCSIT